MYQVLTPGVMHEITPLTPGDCFTISSKVKQDFDFPLHYHSEYELTLLLNAKGAKRIVGGSIGVVDDIELVFIGPNLYHSWFNHQCQPGDIQEITIQFHKDLFGEGFLKRNQLSMLKSMFNNAQRGILFSQETAAGLVDNIVNLKKKTQFEAVLALLSILHTLSVAPNIKLLS
ncbi:MAG: AraC family transcriptional regulator, partial [Mucilaginibacter sp.]